MVRRFVLTVEGKLLEIETCLAAARESIRDTPLQLYFRKKTTDRLNSASCLAQTSISRSFCPLHQLEARKKNP